MREWPVRSELTISFTANWIVRGNFEPDAKNGDATWVSQKQFVGASIARLCSAFGGFHNAARHCCNVKGSVHPVSKYQQLCSFRRARMMLNQIA
jgi:hypothetical protein